MASDLDRVILSTEDAKIASIGREQGIDIPFARPADLAKDYARDVDIVLHAVDACHDRYDETFDVVVIIQATTPYVRPNQFDECVGRLRADGLSCVFTARKVREHPRWTWFVDTDGTAQPYMNERLLPSDQHGQKLPGAYYPTGAAWAVRIPEMRKQKAVYCEPLGIVEVPWETAVDIDDEWDWMMAEAVAQKYGLAPVDRGVSRQKRESIEN